MRRHLRRAVTLARREIRNSRISFPVGHPNQAMTAQRLCHYLDQRYLHALTARSFIGSAQGMRNRIVDPTRMVSVQAVSR